MNDTQHPNNCPPLTIEQIRDLATSIREVFGSNLSREDLADKLLMFLEDVPGYESGENATALIASAWAEYADRALLRFAASDGFRPTETPGEVSRVSLRATYVSSQSSTRHAQNR